MLCTKAVLENWTLNRDNLLKLKKDRFFLYNFVRQKLGDFLLIDKTRSCLLNNESYNYNYHQNQSPSWISEEVLNNNKIATTFENKVESLKKCAIIISH